MGLFWPKIVQSRNDSRLRAPFRFLKFLMNFFEYFFLIITT